MSTMVGGSIEFGAKVPGALPSRLIRSSAALSECLNSLIDTLTSGGMFFSHCHRKLLIAPNTTSVTACPFTVRRLFLFQVAFAGVAPKGMQEGSSNRLLGDDNLFSRLRTHQRHDNKYMS